MELPCERHTQVLTILQTVAEPLFRKNAHRLVQIDYSAPAHVCSCGLLGMLVMFSVRQSEKFVSIKNFTHNVAFLARAMTRTVDMQAALLPVMRIPREHEHLASAAFRFAGRHSHLNSHPPAPVPTIPAWAPCLRPLTPSTVLQGCILRPAWRRLA